jgi:HAD superfamily hydrolase (TIGR01484 family)
LLQLPPGLDPLAVRAVAMDLDGTVLDETFEPSTRTAAAIGRAEAEGIACLIATGRMFVSARRIAEKLGIRRPLVCYQGALVADPVSGEVLVHRPIEAALAREILRAMPVEHARRSNLYIDDELYVWEENAATLRYSQVAGVELHIVGPLADWIERPTTKIVTVGAPEAMDALRDELQPLFSSRAFVAKSLPYFLEFAAPGV